jgi:hypothetical protein
MSKKICRLILPGFAVVFVFFFFITGEATPKIQ